jgi:hypothetical protein
MHEDNDSSWPLFVALSLWGASLLVLVCGSGGVWILKDGLGPDSVESHGWLALSRFWIGVRWMIGLVVVPLHVAGWLFYWYDPGRKTDAPPRWVRSGASNPSG